MQKSVKTDMLFIIVTSAKVESGKLGTGIEVAFGPFRALSSRQLTLNFCCFQLNQPNYIDRDDVIITTTAVHDFFFAIPIEILQFQKRGGGGGNITSAVYI